MQLPWMELLAGQIVSRAQLFCMLYSMLLMWNTTCNIQPSVKQGAVFSANIGILGYFALIIHSSPSNAVYHIFLYVNKNAKHDLIFTFLVSNVMFCTRDRGAVPRLSAEISRIKRLRHQRHELRRIVNECNNEQNV